MKSNLKELMKNAETKEEKEGLMQLIKRMLVLKQMIHIRSLNSSTTICHANTDNIYIPLV